MCVQTLEAWGKVYFVQYAELITQKNIILLSDDVLVVTTLAQNARDLGSIPVLAGLLSQSWPGEGVSSLRRGLPQGRGIPPSRSRMGTPSDTHPQLGLDMTRVPPSQYLGNLLHLGLGFHPSWDGVPKSVTRIPSLVGIWAPPFRTGVPLWQKQQYLQVLAYQKIACEVGYHWL